MRIILTPKDFPKNIEYVLLDTSGKYNLEKLKYLFGKKYTTKYFNNLQPLLKNILKKYCPSSRCTGIKRDFKFNSLKNYIVLYEPDLLSQYDSLINAGWSDDKILVMPLPTTEFWGYWKKDHLFFTDIKGDVDIKKCLNNKGFLQTLFKRKLIQNNLSEYKPDYPQKKDLEFISKTSDSDSYNRSFPFACQALEEIDKGKEKIDFVLRSFSDEKSKDIYQKLIYGTPYDIMENYFINTPKSLQYFEYIKVNPNDVIINVGIDTGFEIPFFCTMMNKNGLIHNIDPEGFDKLAEYSLDFKNSIHGVHFIENRYYLSGESGTKYVDKNSFVFSDFQKDGSVKSDVITIDDFIEKYSLEKVDLIKMDIEGSEIDAVPKMLKTIKRFRPKLAIAVYHKANHFWDIPAFLIENCEDYNFYFNIYSFTCYEGIFYAIPKEKDI